MVWKTKKHINKPVPQLQHPAVIQTRLSHLLWCRPCLRVPGTTPPEREAPEFQEATMNTSASIFHLPHQLNISSFHFQPSLPCSEEWNTKPGRTTKSSLTSPSVRLPPSLQWNAYGTRLSLFPITTGLAEKSTIICCQVSLQFLSLLHTHLISSQILEIINHIRPSGNWSMSNSNCSLFQYLVFMAVTAKKHIYIYIPMLTESHGRSASLARLNQETHFPIPNNNLEFVFISWIHSFLVLLGFCSIIN